MEPGKIASSVREFAQTHTLWMLGLVPIGMAAFKILTISAGDAQTFGYLVQNLDLVGLALSVTLPLIPVTTFWVWVMWFDRRQHLPKDKRKNMDDWSYAIYTLIPFTVIFSQLGYVFPSIVVLANAVRIRCSIPRRNKRLKLRYGVDDNQLWRWAPINGFNILMVLGVQSLITYNIHWLPAESFVIKGQPAQLARVVTVNPTFVGFLNNKNQVVLIKTSEIESRQPCYTDLSRFSVTSTLSTAIFGNHHQTKLKCPKGGD